MEVVTNIINWLAMIVPMLLATGYIAKYVPFLRNFSNKAIPLMNAVIAFLTMFGGTVAVAEAGIFGDIGTFLSVPAKGIAALLVAGATSWVHDRFLKPLLPPGPKPTA